eukprot:gene291-6705_t
MLGQSLGRKSPGPSFLDGESNVDLSNTFSPREPNNTFSDASMRMIGVLTFLIVLFFTFEIRFFSIHPILMTFTYGFLIIEGMLVARQMNIVPSEKKNLLDQHFYIQIVSLMISLFSFSIVYFHRYFLFKTHFKGFHSLFGISTILLTILNVIFGVLLKYGYIKNKFKNYHVIIAYTCIYFGLFTLLLGFLTNYFLNRIWKIFLIIPFSFVLILISMISYPLIYRKRE